MSRLEIKHFLVTYNPENDQTRVEDLGTDYDSDNKLRCVGADAPA